VVWRGMIGRGGGVGNDGRYLARGTWVYIGG
jgi:hypothetical protein